MIRFLSFLTEKGIIPNRGVIPATGKTRKHYRDIDPYLPEGHVILANQLTRWRLITKKYQQAQKFLL